MVDTDTVYHISGPAGFGIDGRGFKIFLHSDTGGSRVWWDPSDDGVLRLLGDAEIIAVVVSATAPPEETGVLWYDTS